MWSNLPDGGAGTKRKQSSVKIPVNLLMLIATKNLVNLQFNHDTKDSHSALLSELNIHSLAPDGDFSPFDVSIILLNPITVELPSSDINLEPLPAT